MEPQNSLEPRGGEQEPVFRGDSPNLPPPDIFDPVIELYKKVIDRTLLIANLRKPVAQRLSDFQAFMNALGETRGAALPSDLREKLFGKQ